MTNYGVMTPAQKLSEKLPWTLKRLADLASNSASSWTADRVSLFQNIDPHLELLPELKLR